MEARIAIVTGCGKRDGIGAAIAMVLARAGISVAATDVAADGVMNKNEEFMGKRKIGGGLAKLVEEIRAEGGVIEPFIGDVSIEADAAALVASTVGRFGGVDVLVNNAAAPFADEHNDIVDIPAAAWDRVMAVNARGTYLMCKYAVPQLRKRSGGRIVNISSAIAKIGRPHSMVYSASKAAIIAFSQCLAVDLGPDGINVNCVCPGRTLTTRGVTDIYRKVKANMSDDEIQHELRVRAAQNPLGRIGEPMEIAEVVGFLCSAKASYLTGQAINVDGGMFPM